MIKNSLHSWRPFSPVYKIFISVPGPNKFQTLHIYLCHGRGCIKLNVFLSTYSPCHGECWLCVWRRHDQTLLHCIYRISFSDSFTPLVLASRHEKVLVVSILRGSGGSVWGSTRTGAPRTSQHGVRRGQGHLGDLTKCFLRHRQETICCPRLPLLRLRLPTHLPSHVCPISHYLLLHHHYFIPFFPPHLHHVSPPHFHHIYLHLHHVSLYLPPPLHLTFKSHQHHYLLPDTLPSSSTYLYLSFNESFLIFFLLFLQQPSSALMRSPPHTSSPHKVSS